MGGIELSKPDTTTHQFCTTCKQSQHSHHTNPQNTQAFVVPILQNATKTANSQHPQHLNPPNTSNQNANRPCNNKNQFSDIPNHALSHLESSTHAICQQSSAQQHKQKSPFNSNPAQYLPHNDQNTVHTYSTKHKTMPNHTHIFLQSIPTHYPTNQRNQTQIQQPTPLEPQQETTTIEHKNQPHTQSPTKHRNNNRVMFPYLSAISKRQQSNTPILICQHWYCCAKCVQLTTRQQLNTYIAK